jgi:O-antigen/teichoic acid export membrane protein
MSALRIPARRRGRHGGALVGRPDETPSAGEPAAGAGRAFGDFSHADLRRRAFGGVFIVFSWSFVKLAVAFFGNLVLARLLTPHDFGLVAVGATAMLIVSAFVDGGLGSGLIRRPEKPTPAELRTLAGIQLIATAIIAATIVAVGLQFGTAGQVTALMAVAMPLWSIQSPGSVRLVRGLHMRQLTVIEAIGLVASYAWSIAAVLAGLGVWGFASGAIARGLAVNTAMALTPEGRLFRPTLELAREFREVLAFGIRFQVNWILIVLREQALNVVTALVAGVTTLGLWSLGSRLMQLPGVLTESIGRVTYPAMSHLLGQGREMGPTIERTARLSATAGAIFFSGFAASTPGLVPALFGSEWSAVVPIFPWTCLGLLITGTVVPAADGYLFAANRPQVILKATIVFGLATIAVSAALLPAVGVAAIGIGGLVGAIVQAAILATAVRRLEGADILAPIVRPLVAASAAGSIGWLIASSASPDLLGGVAGGAAASLLTTGLLGLVCREYLADLLSVVRRSARSAVTRDGQEVSEVTG